MEQLGAGSRTESVQALAEAALKLIGTHGTSHAATKPVLGAACMVG